MGNLTFVGHSSVGSGRVNRVRLVQHSESVQLDDVAANLTWVGWHAAQAAMSFELITLVISLR